MWLGSRAVNRAGGESFVIGLTAPGAVVYVVIEFGSSKTRDSKIIHDTLKECGGSLSNIG